MKKILLLLFLLVSLFANATRIQINFVQNFNINIINPFPGSPSEGTATTDNDINAILSTYNISSCVESFSSPDHVFFAKYLGNNLSGLLLDLKNNANVLKVSICPDDPYSYYWADQLYLKLIDDTIGNSIGTNSNGNIITTSTSLNLIFDTYQVISMVKMSPNLSIYGIYFNGSINDLLNELNNLKGVIEGAEPIGVPMLLSTQSFDSKKISVYPNPFSNTFTINTTENISEYFVVDLSGKQIIKSNSKSDLDTQTSKLVSGIYFLNLQYENGKNANYKLIKK
jgi:hypothetical protein